MKTRNPIIVIFTLLIGALVLSFVNTIFQNKNQNHYPSTSIIIPENDTIMKPLFYNGGLVGLLHHENNNNQNSIYASLSKGHDFNTLSCDFFGISNNFAIAYNKDTVGFKQLYFFTLKVKGFKNHENFYFRNKEDAYIAYPVWDTTNSIDQYNKNRYFAYKKINVRYSSNNDQNVVHIPINKGLHVFLNILIVLIVALEIIFFGYYFLVLPFKIFQQIAKGRAFSATNIEHFNGMYNVAFYFCLINSFLPSLLSLAISNFIPKEFAIESFATILFCNIGYYIFAIILYYVRASFIKGYILQEENALTI